jgi:putative transport protein
MVIAAADGGFLGVLQRLAGALGKQPFILLFLVVAAGYALGRVKIKGIGLGATASTLLIGLALSFASVQLLGVKFDVPEIVGAVFFNLFMFSIGMKVGPQFISGLRRDAGKFVLLAVLVPMLSVAAMLALRALFHLAPGMTAGIFAGSNTATPGLGAAQTAISSGAARIPAGTSNAEVLANMSTAFAFAYCVSMLLFIVLLKLPDLLGRDTARAARELEAQLRGEDSPPLPGSADEFLGRGPAPAGVRTYAVELPDTIGMRLDELRRSYPWISVERILRDGRFLEPRDELVVQAHDTVALYGPVPRLLSAGSHLGPEVPEALPHDLGSQTVDIVAYRDAPADKNLLELSRDLAHGLYLNAIFRGGQAIPFGPDTLVRRGDVLRVTGTEWRLKQLEGQVGRIVRPSVSTDVVTLALGLALGALVGTITLPLGAVRIKIGAAVGLLLVGIGLSTLRTYKPAFGGPYPEPARQLIEDIGLNVFVAVLGISSGAGVVKAIQSGAVAPIIAGCVIVGIIPPILGWLVGRRLLRMNDALLLGAVAGARCNSAGMRAAQETTRSTVPAISYPVTFALSNVILTVVTYLFAMLG